ncbi:MAG TPA: cytochrome c oxidase assembly protein [Bryobacteraceae bacterium]|nr:cytochrome c oxidase assembly protein [Bryobacteraceae bacterium]
MTHWTADPGIVVPLACTGLLYAAGARIRRGTSRTQIACFWIGWAVLVIALVSPLHYWGEMLFWVHMTQHELLMLIAAPLLVLSRPLVPMLWALPGPERRLAGRLFKRSGLNAAWHAVSRPLPAWLLHAAALWLWHAPALFQAATKNSAIHALQHISFLGSALLFWWSLFYARKRTAYGESFLYVFTTAVHSSILGALLTFSTPPWYPIYRITAPQQGLTALQDQQIGGLIMWVPAGIVYLAAGLSLIAMWLREGDLMAGRRVYAH